MNSFFLLFCLSVKVTFSQKIIVKCWLLKSLLSFFGFTVSICLTFTHTFLCKGDIVSVKPGKMQDSNTLIQFVLTSLCPSIDDSVPAEREPGEVVDSLVGKQVEYAKEDGGKRTGMVIHQVEAKPSVYFIKFDDDFLIYVYDLVKTS